MQEEHREERARLRAAESQLVAVGSHLDRPENPELHRRI